MGTFPERCLLQHTASNRVYDTPGRLVRCPLGGFVRDIVYDEAERITSYTHYDALLRATTAAKALNQGFVLGSMSYRLPPQSIVQSTRGFTLLELLVVMVIIGLLASYVAPRYFDQIGKSEIKATRAQLDAFDKALATYRLDTGHFPSTDQSLRALVEKPSDEPKWAGPYLARALPPDPWSHAYVYRNPGDNGRDYELMSLGKDGQRGGTGENADISIWDTGR